ERWCDLYTNSSRSSRRTAAAFCRALRLTERFSGSSGRIGRGRTDLFHRYIRRAESCRRLSRYSFFRVWGIPEPYLAGLESMMVHARLLAGLSFQFVRDPDE